MKIVVIHPIFQPETRGGAEVAVDNIVAGLLAAGHNVVVICVGRKDVSEISANYFPDQNESLTVYRIKPFNLFNFLDINSQPAWRRLPWHIIDMFNINQARRVKDILCQENPDLVLTHNLKGLGYLIPRAIKKLKLKHAHTIHDMQLLHPSGLLVETGHAPSLPVAIYRWFCRWLFGSPETVAFPSEYIKAVYERYGFFKKSHKVVIGNPIQFPIFNLKFSKKTEILNSKFQILFLGQVEAYKGIFELIEALKGVTGDWALNVVGDGKALPKAKILAQEATPDALSGALAGPRIKFWGRLGQSELEKKIWPRINILVNPSLTNESFGMVVVEAYAHGVPALVSGRGALSELVREGETGFVVSSSPFKRGRLGGGDSVESWREKIDWCLTHRREIEGMREKCIKEAEKYKLENYLNRLLNYINN